MQGARNTGAVVMGKGTDARHGEADLFPAHRVVEEMNGLGDVPRLGRTAEVEHDLEQLLETWLVQ